MKKLLTLFTASVLAATMLSGCNNDSMGSNQSGLTFTDEIIDTQDLGMSVGDKLSDAYKPTGENNPIAANVFFADPTSVEYNGRLYVYGTNDSQQYDKNNGTGENSYGNINSLVCYSTADMVNWTYEGTINVREITGWAGCSWAPSIVSKEIKGKTQFFLYFCDSAAGVGVLTSDSPTGPWEDPVGTFLVNGNTVKDDPVFWCFDPGVVVDENGTGWLAFGGGDPVHEDENSMYTGNCRLVKLNDDMVSLASDPVKIPAVHHFEANELNVIGGKLVLTYCSNYGARDRWPITMGQPSQTCSMCYLVCNGDPLNPDDWVYGGEYLTNPNTHGYPFSNNHSHLQKFGDKYYILYQNVSLLENMDKLNVAGGYRSINIDYIDVDEANVKINYAKMTDAGVEQLKNFDPFVINEAESSRTNAGLTYFNTEGRNIVTNISDGDWTELVNVDFADGANAFAATVRGKGMIEVRLDSVDGKAVGNIQFATDGEWKTVRCQLDKTVSGVHDLYFVFGGGSFVFDNWQFANVDFAAEAAANATAE